MSLLLECASGVVNNSIRLKYCCCNLGGGSGFKPRNLKIGLASISRKGPIPPKGTRSFSACRLARLLGLTRAQGAAPVFPLGALKDVVTGLACHRPRVLRRACAYRLAQFCHRQV